MTIVASEDIEDLPEHSPWRDATFRHDMCEAKIIGLRAYQKAVEAALVKWEAGRE